MTMNELTAIDFESYANIIAGEPRDSSSYYTGINPSNGNALWKVPNASTKDMEEAVASAKKAFPRWAKTPVDQRRDSLTPYKAVFIQYKDQLQNLLTVEGGKPREVASMEISIALDYFDHHISLNIDEEKDEVAGKIFITRYPPLGTVAAICPWNFPIVLCLGNVLPALLTGNCIIVKPSPYTPYSALKLVEMARSLFPPGVLQVLGGDDSVGPALVAHPDVQKISFTGSIPHPRHVCPDAQNTLGAEYVATEVLESLQHGFGSVQ